MYFSSPVITESQKHTHPHVQSLLTVAVMKMHLFFFWILFSLAIATSPATKKPKECFCLWYGRILVFTLNHTKHKTPEQRRIQPLQRLYCCCPSFSLSNYLQFSSRIQGPRPTDFQLDLCFQIPQMLLHNSTLPYI